MIRRASCALSLTLPKRWGILPDVNFYKTLTVQSDSLTVPFTLPSFAKINWSLEILGRRPDGYHEIRTLLQTISLRDELHFSEQSDSAIVLTCSDSTIPTDSSNLIIRAAEALRQFAAVKHGASIHLEKR